MKWLLFSFIIAFSLSNLCADKEESQNLVLNEVASVQFHPLIEELKSDIKMPTSSATIVNSWKPYWMLLKQPKATPFFQGNIGIGFLYFSQVQANFTTLPSNIAHISGAEEPLMGKLSYNRTPLFEYLLGYRINNSFKFALSYQTQSGVSLQTTPKTNTSFNPAIPNRDITAIFKANLNINALMLKGYFEYPVPLIWKNIGYNLYAGIGVGPSWQSWTNLQITRIQQGTFSTTATIIEQSLRQKVCANVSWMLDLGLRLRSTGIERPFFMLMGIKYNQWGQARNLGKMSQQGDSKIAFLNPFRIKTLYSFAPYLGVQWNFPSTVASKPPVHFQGHSLKSWKVFFLPANCLGNVKTVWTEFNAGIGFLYFRKVRGSLSSRPGDPLNNLASNVPLNRGGISYNKTPLLEFLTGFRLKPWFKLGMSYQHQSDLSIATQTQKYKDLNTGLNLQNSDTYAQFKGNLILDSIMVKAFLELPYPMIWRGVATAPYLAMGLGPGWQTWNQINIWRYTNSSTGTLTSAAQPIRNKICANAVWMADLGFRLKSVGPSSHFSVVAGCKYIQWGQTRNLGKIDQQDYRCYGLFPPFKIQRIYSFAPYLGVIWDYSIYNKLSSKVLIKGRSPNTWKFYFASINEVQPKQSVWFEYSLGMGFLYFHKVKGYLAQTPSVQSAGYTGISPLSRELSYNRTPLYEFMVGYRYLSWFKLCLSYQTQRNVSIVTKYDRPSVAAEINNAVEFKATLQLESFMAKAYFELPQAIIIKNLATSFYLGLGMGPSWQSWTQMEYRLVSVAARRAQYYNQKTCASVGFMADLGFRVQSISSDGAFSITKGMKYIQWGQARNLGDIKQQGSLKTGLFKPIAVKVIYSFAPYLGVQWNF